MFGVKRGIIGDAKWKRKVSLLERDSKKELLMHIGWRDGYSTDKETKQLTSSGPHGHNWFLEQCSDDALFHISKIKPVKEQPLRRHLKHNPGSHAEHYSGQAPRHPSHISRTAESWFLTPVKLSPCPIRGSSRSIPIQTIYCMILWHTLSALGPNYRPSFWAR